MKILVSLLILFLFDFWKPPQSLEEYVCDTRFECWRTKTTLQRQTFTSKMFIHTWISCAFSYIFTLVDPLHLRLLSQLHWISWLLPHERRRIFTEHMFSLIDIIVGLISLIDICRVFAISWKIDKKILVFVTKKQFYFEFYDKQRHWVTTE